jgi:hypothetical protein
MGDVYQDRGQDEKRTKGRVAMMMLVLDLLELHGRGLALARHGGLFGYHDRSSILIYVYSLFSTVIIDLCDEIHTLCYLVEYTLSTTCTLSTSLQETRILSDLASRRHRRSRARGGKGISHVTLT